MRVLTRFLLIALGLAALGLVITLIVQAQRAEPLATTAPATAAAPAEKVEPAEARPLTPRGGIGNFAAKLKAGGDVTVAFMGGPITAAGGDRGYPGLVTRWLTLQYPGSRIKFVDAGLVDGGSFLGAARLDRDVLRHRPDLLFVDFAVDDQRDPRSRHVERLVRKAWTADPRMDIVLIYALHNSHLPDLRAGKLPVAASTHERVAAHYEIPSIAMGLEVISRLDAGEVKWRDLFSDDWHPTPKGQAVYADAIIAALQQLLREPPPPRDHSLKGLLNRDLVLYPTTRQAEPMPTPPPLTDASGRPARETYTMPLVGIHWVGSPEFKDPSGRVLWRLLTQSARENGRRLNADFGLDRSRWGAPMTWFEEWGQFTGPAGVYLVYNSRTPNHLTAREDDLPIVTFTAPQAGRYVVKVKSANIIVWGLHRALALNVVHFPAGQNIGRSIAFHRTQAGIAENVDINVEVRLAEGDDIAFEVDTNAIGGGGGAAYRETDITIGWFGD